jgi:collagenase-like PrtC family protease
MIFTVGYQHFQTGERFSSIIKDFRDRVKEVYFPWVNMPSGRPHLEQENGIPDWTAQHVLEEELQSIKKHGVKLDLLLNSNCYGAHAISIGLEKEVLSIIEHLDNIGCCPDVITTASPFIARTIKQNCAGIEVRASVNMRIGTTQSMDYVEELFDSYYIQRDLQRNLAHVRKVHDWCVLHGKKLCLLANSGCLRFCPNQSFHDNLIAHSKGASNMQNVTGWNPHICWQLYKDSANFSEILKSTWIRPEEIHLYEGLVDTIKLATRQHSHPHMVIGAYTDGEYRGNLLELFEPGFSLAFFPYYVDNTAFPGSWAEKTSKCELDCGGCNFCDSIASKVIKKY